MSASKGPFEAYVASLRKTGLREKTEQTDRDAIKALLQHIAPSGITVVHEAKGVRGKGTPDFKVRRNGQIVGYVEVKPIGTDLKPILKSDQIARYKTLSKNIIVTDYLTWVWMNGDSAQSARLCDKDVIIHHQHLNDERVAEVQKLLAGFTSSPPATITRSEVLAYELANRSRLLRDFLAVELLRQEEDERGERLYGLYKAFKQQVSEDITLREFADAFSQTLSYGLFLSKLNANGYSLKLSNAKQYIPKAFKLIQELVGFIDVLDNEAYVDIKWVVDEILSIINGIDIPSVRADLSFRNRRASSRSLRAKDEEEWRLFSRDPFIYFYEDYLAQYDAKLRKSRGVYYTPPPIVNFIIRAIDDTLKQQFALKGGLADYNRVTMLEFACGTGTFLVEAIERILENIGGTSTSRALPIIKEHALKNFYAFEFLIAPYTIAHLKLAQYLDDRQIRIGDGQRFNIYLTNTLEPLDPQRNFFLPALSEESRAAAAVKKKQVLVITGNPPYSGHSRNKGKWITNAIEEYKYTLESNGSGHAHRQPLGEKNPKWLQDDYVKFIRFAQMKMDAIDEGVVGIITNHSYLDNPTFRGMRQSLTRTFDQIFVFDLHGNLKKKERDLDGGLDENVFDIEQGVAIGLFVKKPGLEKGVWHADLRGSRIHKYKSIATAKKESIQWKKLEPVSPFYLFIPQNRDAWAEYEAGLKVTDIFPVNVLGFQTHRDHFAIAFTREEIEERVSNLRSERYSTVDLAREYGLKDNRDWSLQDARTALKADRRWKDKIVRCDYRPFDKRWCLFGYELMDYPRRELLDHAFCKENVHLLISRQVRLPEWRHVGVSDTVAESCFVSLNTKEQNYVFPLYLYESSKTNRRGELFFEVNGGAGERRRENISSAARALIRDKYQIDVTAEELFAYTYAILHAHAYRTRYSEFLRIDFPRIPFPDEADAFNAFAALGAELMDMHLMRRIPNVGTAKYEGAGSPEIEQVRYSNESQSIFVNDLQHFSGISPKAWDFQVGGHRVLERFLKSRKGQKLALADVDTVCATSSIAEATLNIASRVDALYREHFPN